MAQVNVEVNGRPYAVGCEDGQEHHLIELAKMFDHQVRQVSQDMGQLGDTRLFLMGALLLADEVVGQLDSVTANHVVDVLFGAELAVVFVTHDEALAARGERQLIRTVRGAGYALREV